ncbi:C2 domain-containing protein [Crepidotus variabilis]|uniref:C2 domain-containing protein n=1 Tax=Crepidotus variabilis TaxID=179855 RepID=A0A9P6ESR7_9AGAR|nr:C2 domain-containing protein [Crepidotus variabilis]
MASVTGMNGTTHGEANAEATAIVENEASKANMPVHTFDPDATPEQKAAQAGKARDKLHSAKHKENTEREVDIADTQGAPPPVPTIVIQDLGNGEKGVKPSDEHVKETTPPPVEDDGAGQEGVPGALPGKEAYVIPDWYKVGWRQVSGIDEAPVEGEAKDKTVLEMFLSEQFYGEWYYNAGIIVFAVFASHFMTRFHLGWGWLFILLAICNTYYSTSMKRVRRNARDDIQRELVKTSLASEHESAEWINNFLERFWKIYEPILSATVVSTVDQILSINTPAFLDSLRLSTFTLGSKAPKIDKVRTFPKTDDDIVMMDWGISFTPKDTSEMTEKQKKDQSNPKITLMIRLGKGLATAGLPVLVENISFTGLLRIKMKLMSTFPHVQVVDISFLEQPVIDFVLKPIGGDTFGFDIANLPGLSTFIHDMIHANLRPMMYDPNVFSLNLEQLLSGKPLDAAIGVVQVVVRAARNIKGSKIGGGTPDPYVSLTINDRAELARTKYKLNTYNPTWMETKYILVNNLTEQLIFNLWDYNDHRKNTKLSAASFQLQKLLEDSTQEDIVSPLLKEGKERGELRYDVNFFPVIEPESDASDDNLMQSTVGIVRLVLHQAKELDSSKSMSGSLNPFAKVYLNHATSSSYQTPLFKHTNNPIWEAPYEFLCTDKENTVITVKVVDDRDILKDPIVGYLSIKLTDLMEAKKLENRDWFPLSGCKQGKFRMSAEFRPLAMSGALHGSDQYVPPIGVVRLVVNKAIDVKNVEAALGGKSDPYVRVQVQNVTKGRTEVINNNLNPVWDQIIYIPVHSLRENLLLECMDYQHLTRDRSLGTTELHVSDIAVANSEDTRYPFKSLGVKPFDAPLRQDHAGASKGTLQYTAEFIPSLALKGVKFESDQAEVTKLARKSSQNSEEGGVVTDDNDSSDDDVPAEITIKKDSKKKHIFHRHHGGGSKESIASVNSTHTTGTSGTHKSVGTNDVNGAVTNGHAKEETGVEMSNEELLTNQSGIIVFHVISGQLHKKARLEVLLDDGYWPCFSTMKARSSHAQWGYVGEGFVKEVDFGRVWLRLNESDDPDKDEFISEWKGDAKAFLAQTMNGPATYELKDRDDRLNASVTIEARYIPVPVKLEARESVNNQGILRVDLLDGHDIRGADRSGKSDPYAVFSLNGQKVFKSQTKKKTITPEWNEHFEVSVPSRVGADFSVELFDWNQIEQAKSLGAGKIELATIEPFAAAEQIIPLSSAKHGDKGQIRVRLVFQPEIIAKSRKSTSTFSSAGRAMTQFGGLPVHAGKGVVHGVAGVFKRKDKNEDDVFGSAPAPIDSQATSGVVDAQSMTATLPSETTNGPSLPGTLRVRVIDAKDLSQTDVKPYASLRLGDKEFKTKHPKSSTPEWNETFTFGASSMTPKLFVWIHDHKTLGKDKELGEGDIDIWRHIKSDGISSNDVEVSLRPSGTLRLRLEFDPSNNAHNGSSPSLNGDALSKSLSSVSPSRFSLRGRRPGTENDD